MRMFVIKQETDLEGLSSKLLRGRTSEADAGAAIERVKALNPHVDFASLSAGTVLLVPDSPEIKESAAASFSGDTLQDVIKDVDSGLKTSGARVKQGFERLSADRTSVSAVLKVAAVKKIVDSDPVLKKQLEAADAQFKEDQKKATAAQKLLEDVQKKAIEELAELQKLLG